MPRIRGTARGTSNAATSITVNTAAQPRTLLMPGLSRHSNGSVRSLSATMVSQ